MNTTLPNRPLYFTVIMMMIIFIHVGSYSSFEYINTIIQATIRGKKCILYIIISYLIHALNGFWGMIRGEVEHSVTLFMMVIVIMNICARVFLPFIYINTSIYSFFHCIWPVGVDVTIKQYDAIDFISWVLWLNYDDEWRNDSWQCRDEQFVKDKYVL